MLLTVSTAGVAQVTVAPVPDQPLRIQPQVPEIGMGDWTPPGSGTQPTDPSQGGGTITGGGGSGTDGTSDALSLMQSQSWGQSATNAAQALGVNPNALAATCMIESQCNSSAQNGSSTGAFQMQGAAFQDGLNTALAANPSLLSQIVPGSAGTSDPTTQAIAAAGYLMQADQALTAAGVQNPTSVDARSYYEFGPSYGKQVALASGSTTMGSLLPSSFLTSNNISAVTTVAEWQASVAAKEGNAGTATIMS